MDTETEIAIREAIDKGEVLACRIYPLTDLIIECVPQPEAAFEEQTTTKA